jgi:hypothetical protein
VNESMSVRELPPEEWHKLEASYAENGGRLPPVGGSKIYVVEEGGAIIGSIDLVLLPFVGLARVEESRRGERVATLLAHAVASVCSEGDSLFTYTTSEASKRICENMGCVKLDGEIWRKDF